MSLSKKVENLVIGFNSYNNIVEILHNKGRDFRNVQIDEFVCDNAVVQPEELAKILDSILNVYLAENVVEQPDVYIVLPDSFVAFDQILLPSLPQPRLKDALKSDLKKLYTNYSELSINAKIMNKNKRNVTYNCTLVKKSIINACVTALKKHNLNLRNITYASSAFANSFFALGTRVKHTPHILIDINENFSRLIYSAGDKTLINQTLPFGHNILFSNKIQNERLLFDNSSAEFAVFAAKQKAKSKKITPEEEEELETFEEYAQKLHKLSSAVSKNFYKNIQEEEPISANLQLFLKHTYLMAEQVQKENFPNVEYIIFNIKSDYKSEILKLEEKNKDAEIKIKYLADEINEKCSLMDYFDLYGAVYAVMFNKGHNFYEKESNNFITTLVVNIKIFFKDILNKIKSIFKK